MSHRPTRKTLLRWLALALLTPIILAGCLWLLRFGAPLVYPQWPRLQPDQQADLANKFQTLLIQTAGALGAGVAVWFTYRTYRLSRRGQVTDRFTKALEQLDSSEKYLRLAGVHVLEQVLTDAPDHHNAIAEVLVAFTRQRAPRRSLAPSHPDQPDTELPWEPDPDVQAALTVLGRRPRRPEQKWLDLHDLHLAGANLRNANLTSANLDRVNLNSAILANADLTGANLHNANLTVMVLHGVTLTDAFLTDADLTGAILTDANLTGADLHSADLRTVFLRESNLTGAHFGGANLTGADLTGTNLTGTQFLGTNLTRTDLTGTNLSDADLTDANLTGAKVPADATLPPWWERDPGTGLAVRSSSRDPGMPQDDSSSGAEVAEPDPRA